LTIGESARGTDGDSQLFAGKIVITNPGGDHRQIFDHCGAIDCIFFHRQKLDRTSACAQCFLFAPEASVDQT